MVVGILMNLGCIVGPVWAGFVFDVNVNYPYLSGTVFMFTGFLPALVLTAPVKTEAPEKGIETAKVDIVQSISTLLPEVSGYCCYCYFVFFLAETISLLIGKGGGGIGQKMKKALSIGSS
jgi:hypothetical protein